MALERKLSTLLTLAGTIPFIVGAFALGTGLQSPVSWFNVEVFFYSYGLLILSFMAGVHWGQHLHMSADSRWRSRLPVFSNALTIGVWLGYLTLAGPAYAVLLSVAFSCLLWIDSRLKAEGIISPEYFQLRGLATLIVIVCLLSTLATNV